MPEWIPSESSSKGRLVLRALDAFSAEAFDEVNVVALCAAARVTTGTLYHHFGTKLGLYEVVRLEVERRVVDRAAGALAARAQDPPAVAVRAALLVAFDYVVETGRVRLMGAPTSPGHSDLLEATVRTTLDPGGAGPRVWVAAWRAALMCTLDGFDVATARSALASLRIDDR